MHEVEDEEERHLQLAAAARWQGDWKGCFGHFQEADRLIADRVELAWATRRKLLESINGLRLEAASGGGHPEELAGARRRLDSLPGGR